ncbi:MAG TPA: site-specific DNA-methyltransferase, partial [Spirochaetes bacterium]|nr:site-specific DNA-methyltransferase [Spirochaetota bacterium]
FIDCVVTSPPYWGLRDYGIDGQLGLEKTPEKYISKMVTLFREVRSKLKPTGTLWLNMGDSYAANGGSSYQALDVLGEKLGIGGGKKHSSQLCGRANTPPGLKTKDLCMMPHRLAMALQADGWWIRSDIVWNKTNPMPESVTDRPTKSHEYIFLCTKSAKYYYDADAIREGASYNTHERVSRAELGQKSNPDKKKSGIRPRKVATAGSGIKNNDSFDAAMNKMPDTRNKRSVWTVPTAPYPEAHFATFPPKLIEPCILGGCPEWVCKKCGKARERIIDKGELVADSPQYKPRGTNRGDNFVKNAMTPAGEKQGHPNFHYESKTTGWTDCGCNAGFDGGIVFDPFMGSGTTAVVAYENRRQYLGIELNQEYIDMGRIDKTKAKYGLFDD